MSNLFLTFAPCFAHVCRKRTSMLQPYNPGAKIILYVKTAKGCNVNKQ